MLAVVLRNVEDLFAVVQVKFSRIAHLGLLLFDGLFLPAHAVEVVFQEALFTLLCFGPLQIDIGILLQKLVL